MADMAWIVLLIVVGLAGAVLSLLGLRGRRADEHPLCRRCGFDLTGNPAAAVCAECGADLTRPKATRVGHRVRRTRALAAGVALLVPVVLVLVVIGWGAAAGVDWQRHKPLGWLRHELSASDPATANAAAKELLRRESESSLSEAVWQDLTAAALRVQSDPAAAWEFTAWPDALGTALARNLLTRPQRDGYTRTALGMNPAGPTTGPADPKRIPEYRTAKGDDGLARTRLDDLDPPTLDAAVARALDCQADADVGWSGTPWPNVLRAGLDRHLLDAAQRRRYLLNAVPLARATRPVVRRGDPFAFKLSPDDGRAAQGDAVLAVADWLGVEAAGEHLLPADGPPRHSDLESFTNGANGWQPWNLPAHTAGWPLGPATAVGRFRLQIGRNPTGTLADPPDGTFPGTPEVDTQVTLREQFLVVDPGDPRSWLVTDDDKRAVMNHAVVASPVTPSPASPGDWEINFRLHELPGAAAAPAAISADVLLRSGGREVAQEGDPVYLFDANFPTCNGCGIIVSAWPTESGRLDDSLDRVDVILRPAVVFNATRPGDTPVWGREIVIPNVPIHRDRPATPDEWYGTGGRVEWKPQ